MTKRAAIRRDYSWERKLRPALRGTRGYAAQKDAWDAVGPEWRKALKLVNRRVGRGRRLSTSEREFLDQWSALLLADNRRLAGPWYQLLMQDLYRSLDRTLKRRGDPPARWGWYPK